TGARWGDRHPVYLAVHGAEDVLVHRQDDGGRGLPGETVSRGGPVVLRHLGVHPGEARRLRGAAESADRTAPSEWRAGESAIPERCLVEVDVRDAGGPATRGGRDGGDQPPGQPGGGALPRRRMEALRKM